MYHGLSPLPGFFFLGTQAKGAVDGADAMRFSRKVNRALQILGKGGRKGGRETKTERHRDRQIEKQRQTQTQTESASHSGLVQCWYHTHIHFQVYILELSYLLNTNLLNFHKGEKGPEE